LNDLTEFQQRAAAVATMKMLGQKHFSICDLDAIAKTIGRESFLAGRDYAALRAVHCVDWADMGPELALMVREKCLDMLGLPPQTIEVLTPEKQREPAQEPAKRLRLAFWRAA
jgi:hypothetical protein